MPWGSRLAMAGYVETQRMAQTFLGVWFLMVGTIGTLGALAMLARVPIGQEPAFAAAIASLGALFAAIAVLPLVITMTVRFDGVALTVEKRGRQVVAVPVQDIGKVGVEERRAASLLSNAFGWTSGSDSHAETEWHNLAGHGFVVVETPSARVAIGSRNPDRLAVLVGHARAKVVDAPRAPEAIASTSQPWRRWSLFAYGFLATSVGVASLALGRSPSAQAAPLAIGTLAMVLAFVLFGPRQTLKVSDEGMAIDGEMMLWSSVTTVRFGSVHWDLSTAARSLRIRPWSFPASARARLKKGIQGRFAQRQAT